jgi:hypothetical protein
MASKAQIFDELLTRLRSRIPTSVRLVVVKKESDHLAIQVGDSFDSVVGIRIKDPIRPFFAMSYPKLTVKKDGSRRVGLEEIDRAVFDGVERVVEQLAIHGVVKPEFVD